MLEALADDAVEENDLDALDVVLVANSRMILDDHNRISDVAAEGIIADNEIVKLLEEFDQVRDKVNVVGVANERAGLVRVEGDAHEVAEARKKVDWGQ